MKTTTENPGSRVVRKIRIRAIVFLVLAIVAGAAAVLLVKVYLDKARADSASAPVVTKPVVVAKMDLPIAQILSAKDLAIVRWPAKDVPAGSFSDPKQLVGRSLTEAMVKGEPLVSARLADKKRGRGLAALLKPGERAMAVKVDQVIGVAGFVQPGDYVDVITTMSPDDDPRHTYSKIILQNIEVLAVGEHLATKGRKPVKVQVVTLDVTPDQSERLALASQHGSIQLTMRSRIDQAKVQTPGTNPVALLSGEPKQELAQNQQAQTKPQHPQPRHHHHHHYVRRNTPAPAAKKKPQAPVVEILRGTRQVEKRTLQRSADSESK